MKKEHLSWVIRGEKPRQVIGITTELKNAIVAAIKKVDSVKIWNDGMIECCTECGTFLIDKQSFLKGLQKILEFKQENPCVEFEIEFYRWIDTDFVSKWIKNAIRKIEGWDSEYLFVADVNKDCKHERTIRTEKFRRLFHFDFEGLLNQIETCTNGMEIPNYMERFIPEGVDLIRLSLSVRLIEEENGLSLLPFDDELASNIVHLILDHIGHESELKAEIDLVRNTMSVNDEAGELYRFPDCADVLSCAVVSPLEDVVAIPSEKNVIEQMVQDINCSMVVAFNDSLLFYF